MEIIWTEESLNSHIKIIDYLFEKWTLKEVLKFDSQVNNFTSRLLQFNELCPISKLPPYRKCVLNKQTSQVYFIFK